MSRTITLENGKQVPISQESYDALAEELTPGRSVVVKAAQEKQWKPENGEEYYLIDTWGTIGSFEHTSTRLEDWQLSQRNVFRTEEEAEKHLEYLKALAVLKDDAEDWVPDWSDDGQSKWFVGYQHRFDTLVLRSVEDQQYSDIYFETKEKAQHSIDTHREEWLAVLNVKGQEV